MSPGSSLPITNPFLQSQPQYDYFLGSSLVSVLDYSYNGSTPGLTTDNFFSKNAFDMPLGFDYRGISSPIMTNPFNENNFLDIYTVS